MHGSGAVVNESVEIQADEEVSQETVNECLLLYEKSKCDGNIAFLISFARRNVAGSVADN
jgi:hypothetical protein